MEVFAAKLAETARTSPATDTNGLKAALKKGAQQKKQKLKLDKECPKYRCKKKLTDDDAKLCSTCAALGLCHTYSCKKKMKEGDARLCSKCHLKQSAHTQWQKLKREMAQHNIENPLTE